MDCGAYREAISARIDGEDGGIEGAAVDAHLVGCPGCRWWAQAATAVTRSARVGLAEPVPDLTSQIVAALDSPARGGHRVGAPWRPRPTMRRVGPSTRPGPAPDAGAVGAVGAVGVVAVGVVGGPGAPTLVGRLGLVLVAGAQLCLAVPALLGNDAGASIHVAHEQGSWALALAVGFLLVAVRPSRAVAMLPVVAALAAGLALTMAVDIAAGRTEAAAEAPHGLAFLGLGLLGLLTREIRDARAPGIPRPA